VVVGYVQIRDWIDRRQANEYRRLASVVAETSIAAELHRDNQSAFFKARDSILMKHKVSLEEMDTLYKKFEKDWPQASVFWKYVADITDSLVLKEDSLLKAIRKDSTRDSASRAN